MPDPGDAEEPIWRERDRFAFWAVSHSGFGAGDTITDFDSGTDVIALNGIAPGGAFVGSAAFAAAGAIDVRYDATAGELQVDINNDGVFNSGDLQILVHGSMATPDLLFL